MDALVTSPIALAPGEFAARVLAWFDRHGRKDLPWQQNPTPYRVWVSEVMLQQTQVSTVIPYFQRFMARFPSLAALASAGEDEVLALWSGLGYYARGRNLLQAARHIATRHGGEFPATLAEVMDLPGIGRSTAGAILSLSRGEYHAILDGNVKRVLCRFWGITEWPGTPATLAELWGYATALTPVDRCGAYNQAMMDLGATLCTRSRPQCPACPLREACAALHRGLVASVPAAKPRKAMPVRAATMLVLQNAAGEILLQRRPPAGLWGGLWCLPECAMEEDPVAWARAALGVGIDSLRRGAAWRHTFSHFHLDIQPIYASVQNPCDLLMDRAPTVWYNSRQPATLGLAAPVSRLIQQAPLIEDE